MAAPPRNSLGGAGPDTPLVLNLGGVGPASPTPGGVAKSQLYSPLGQDWYCLQCDVATYPFLILVSSSARYLKNINLEKFLKFVNKRTFLIVFTIEGVALGYRELRDSYDKGSLPKKAQTRAFG